MPRLIACLRIRTFFTYLMRGIDSHPGPGQDLHDMYMRGLLLKKGHAYLRGTSPFCRFREPPSSNSLPQLWRGLRPCLRVSRSTPALVAWQLKAELESPLSGRETVLAFSELLVLLPSVSEGWHVLISILLNSFCRIIWYLLPNRDIILSKRAALVFRI